MDAKIGKVLEVFIPCEKKENQFIDVMDINKIGFKVQIDDEIVELVLEQNEFNANIFKNDLVLITRQIISGKEYIDIELFDGDNNE